MSSEGRIASIRARLLARAKTRKEDFSLVLNRYAVERFVYRISRSGARDQFVLKGALLFDLWFMQPHRPTSDADFLGIGNHDVDSLALLLREMCALEFDDGMSFDPATIAVREIREEATYGGLRASLRGTLGDARCAVQLDVGLGDVVTPAPAEAEMPAMLDDVPPVRLRVYPRESVVSEKLEAIVALGMANSRMKDYFDLHALMREAATNEASLVRAIAATFERRKAALPNGLPLGLTSEFASDPAKQRQWGAFLARNRLDAVPLEVVLVDLAGWLMPLIERASIQAPDV